MTWPSSNRISLQWTFTLLPFNRPSPGWEPGWLSSFQLRLPALQPGFNRGWVSVDVNFEGFSLGTLNWFSSLIKTDSQSITSSCRRIPSIGITSGILSLNWMNKVIFCGSKFMAKHLMTSRSLFLACYFWNVMRLMSHWYYNVTPMRCQREEPGCFVVARQETSCFRRQSTYHNRKELCSNHKGDSGLILFLGLGNFTGTCMDGKSLWTYLFSQTLEMIFGKSLASALGKLQRMFLCLQLYDIDIDSRLFL